MLLRPERELGAEDVLVVVDAFHALDEAVHGQVLAGPFQPEQYE